MDGYFAKPTPQKIANYIHNQIILTHETGGRGYAYQIPHMFPLSFVNEVIERLGEFLLDVDVIELNNGYIVIDWS